MMWVFFFLQTASNLRLLGNYRRTRLGYTALYEAQIRRLTPANYHYDPKPYLRIYASSHPSHTFHVIPQGDAKRYCHGFNGRLLTTLLMLALLFK